MRGFAWVWVFVLLGCPAGEGAESDGSTGDPSSSTGAAGSTSSATSSSGDPTTPASTGEPDTVCGEARSCLQPAPSGWTGPVVIQRGTDPDALLGCDDPFPATAATRFEGFSDPGPAECSCECVATADQCNFGPGIMPGGCPGILGATEGCNAASFDNQDFQASPVFVGACSEELTEVIPEVPWTAVARTCEGAASDEVCDDEDRVCVNDPPDGFEDRICIIADDDVDCPAGDYSEKIVLWAGAMDDRACSNCTCGRGVCAESYDYFESDDCSGMPTGSIAEGSCETLTFNSLLVDFSGAACPITTDTAAEGQVSPEGAQTYCCATPT